MREAELLEQNEGTQGQGCTERSPTTEEGGMLQVEKRALIYKYTVVNKYGRRARTELE